MSITNLKPRSQDDQIEQIGVLFCCKLIVLPILTIINAGMGSGKTRLMSRITERISINNNTAFVTIIISPSAHLQTQTIESFKEYKFIHQIELIYEDILEKTSRARKKCKHPIVFMNNIASKDGKMNGSYKKLSKLLEIYRDNSLVIFDEIDLVLTKITGGINAKLDHSDSMLIPYKKVLDQPDTSLNMFDIIRTYGAKCIGLSGTCNNFICSKIPSTGYARDEINIINVHPIKSLYKDLRIVPISIDANNIDKLEKYLEWIESTENITKKALLIFSNKSQMKSFIREYKKKYKITPSYVEITGDNATQRKTTKWRETLMNAKYVFGINLVGVGFDLATFCEGQQFELGILFRKLCDKSSQPLSKNSKHALHVEYSASFLQAVARLRKGGVFIVPETSQITSLYDGLVKVFETIRDGHDQCKRVGPPRKTQNGRYNQDLILNLMQNIREGEDREVVKDIVDRLEKQTSRNFKTEYLTTIENASTFDVEFWTDAIGELWKTLLIERGICCTRTSHKYNKSDLCGGYSNDSNSSVEKSELEIVSSNSSSECDIYLRESENELDAFCPIPFDNSPPPRLQNTRITTSMSPELFAVSIDSSPEYNTYLCDSDSSEEYENSYHNKEFIDSNDISNTVLPSVADEIDYNTTTSVGGERDPRIIDLQVKEEVIVRANGICGHCGDQFESWEVPQICHIMRHDEGGGYTADNLIHGHTSCDALYDEGRIIHDPMGGYWVHRKIPNHKPDKKQVSKMNPAYILHRWNWEKTRQLCETMSDEEFREQLESKYSRRFL